MGGKARLSLIAASLVALAIMVTAAAVILHSTGLITTVTSTYVSSSISTTMATTSTYTTSLASSSTTTIVSNVTMHGEFVNLTPFEVVDVGGKNLSSGPFAVQLKDLGGGNAYYAVSAIVQLYYNGSILNAAHIYPSNDVVSFNQSGITGYAIYPSNTPVRFNISGHALYIKVSQACEGLCGYVKWAKMQLLELNPDYSTHIFTFRYNITKSNNGITVFQYTNFTKNQSWRETPENPGLGGAAAFYNFTSMHFAYANGTLISFYPNVSNCYPTENIFRGYGPAAPFEGRCFNTPKGNYTIYGYLNAT
jgi:hypothetical protein